MRKKEEINLSTISIENRILTLRNQQVMLDQDLAEMYQVETKALNQAVKRNLERFPKTYRFQLSESEYQSLHNLQAEEKHLRSHFVASRRESRSNHGGRRYLPYAFNEQGVAMLTAVLKSEIAIKVSIEIMNTFVQMRKVFLQHNGLYNRLDGLERKQFETESELEVIFKALDNKKIKSQGIFFEGQVFDAYELTSQIIRSARRKIILNDHYIDENTLTHLAKKQMGVSVYILSRMNSKQIQLDIQKANTQYGSFYLKNFHLSHDRFLIIDE